MEDGQILADRTEDSTPDCQRIIAAAGGLSRPSSSSFGLRWRAFHKLARQTGLRTTSAITSRWGLTFCASALCILRMMPEAGSSSVTGRPHRMQHAQLASSWHGPEDSEAATPSQQLGQFKRCEGGKAALYPSRALCYPDAKTASSHFLSGRSRLSRQTATRALMALGPSSPAGTLCSDSQR